MLQRIGQVPRRLRELTEDPHDRGNADACPRAAERLEGLPGLEPGTPSLRVPHLQGFYRIYGLLILVGAGWIRSEVLCSGASYVKQTVVGRLAGAVSSW